MNWISIRQLAAACFVVFAAVQTVRADHTSRIDGSDAVQAGNRSAASRSGLSHPVYRTAMRPETAARQSPSSPVTHTVHCGARTALSAVPPAAGCRCAQGNGCACVDRMGHCPCKNGECGNCARCQGGQCHAANCNCAMCRGTQSGTCRCVNGRCRCGPRSGRPMQLAAGSFGY